MSEVQRADWEGTDELPRTWEDVFSPAQRIILSQIADVTGFTIGALPGATPDSPGYMTDMRTRVVYFNPHTINTLPEFRKFACFGHELGHHFEQVVAFQNRAVELIPAAKGLFPADFKYKDKLLGTLINVMADVLLESIIPKSKEVLGGRLIEACFRENRGLMMIEGPIKAEDHLVPSIHEKLSRTDISEKERTQLTEDLEAVTSAAAKARRQEELFEASNRQVFPWDEETVRNMKSYQQFLDIFLIGAFFNLPDEDWLKPAVQEVLADTNEIIAKLKSPGMLGDQKGLLFLQAVRLLGRLIESDYEEISNSGSPAEALQDYNREIEEVTGQIDCLTEPNQEGESDEHREKRPRKVQDPEELLRKQREAWRNGIVGGLVIEDEQIIRKAAELKVRPETYRRFLKTCREYASQIDDLTETLARFILRQFAIQTVGGQADGFMVEPGREVETYGRAKSGEDTPHTLINRIRKRTPKTLQLYKLIDVSDSMKYDIEATLAYYTIVAMAAYKTHQELKNNPAKYDLGKLKRYGINPLEIEITAFDSFVYLLIPFTGDVTEMTLVQGYEQIIDRIEKGLGTDDARALKYEHQRMRQQDPDTLKILSMITDGYGAFYVVAQAAEKAKGEDRKRIDEVEKVIREIEDDRSIYFLVVGVGESGQGVQDSYQKMFRPVDDFRVHADWSIRVRDAIPKLIAFLKTQIEEHFRE